MKAHAIAAIAIALIGFAAPARAATVSYQVTGPVLELTDSKIVIQKDSEKWEIARTTDTKVTGDLKVGAKVTVMYTMTATGITVKPDKAAAPAVPAKPVKPAAAPAKPEKKP